jgi:hypothetical protein
MLNPPAYRNYGGIYVNDNAVVSTISLVESFFHITVFDTNLIDNITVSDQANNSIVVGDHGDYEVDFTMAASAGGTNKEYEFDVFEISSTQTTITGATQATPVVITAVSHGLENGDYVKIENVGGMVELNDRIFVVSNKTADTFELHDDNSTDINGTAFTAFTTGGTVALAIKTLCHAHRRFSVADVGSLSGSSTISLSDGYKLELHIKNITDSTNITVESCSFRLFRVG